MATERNPPLYIHIVCADRDALQNAVSRVEALINKELGSLVDERRFRRETPHNVERDEFGRRKWPEDKVPIGIPISRQFYVRQTIVGPGGVNVKHIQQETHVRVQVKGHGSGYIENSTGKEADEPMFLHLTYVLEAKSDVDFG